MGALGALRALAGLSNHANNSGHSTTVREGVLRPSGLYGLCWAQWPAGLPSDHWTTTDGAARQVKEKGRQNRTSTVLELWAQAWGIPPRLFSPRPPSAVSYLPVCWCYGLRPIPIGCVGLARIKSCCSAGRAGRRTPESCSCSSDAHSQRQGPGRSITSCGYARLFLAMHNTANHALVHVCLQVRSRNPWICHIDLLEVTPSSGLFRCVISLRHIRRRAEVSDALSASRVMNIAEMLVYISPSYLSTESVSSLVHQHQSLARLCLLACLCLRLR